MKKHLFIAVIIHNLLKALKIGIALALFFSFSEEVNAQGNDIDNHYKGLLSNRFDSLEKWSCHFQFTDIVQGHPAFHTQYSGRNSLHDTSETAMSVTSTLYIGRKLWKGAAIFVDPEIAGGKGMSYALGLAGAANGETFRVGNPAPALYMARGYFEQHFALRKKCTTEHCDGEQNQLADNIPTSRITVTLGKFSLADFFDDNAYGHDPRSEFMNWALMDNGAWDYPANTRGYTWGGVVEIIEPTYAIRLSSVLVPKLANSQVYDLNIKKASGNTAEYERKFKIKNHPGNLHFLGYANYSLAPSYKTAISEIKKGDSAMINVIDGTATGAQYGVKYGFGISFNQELTNNIGIFSRVGWNNGQTATWAFTEIDQTATLGIHINGDIIKRPTDNFGIACVINGISADHRDYLNAGGYGFIIGDGKLTHYGYEQIMETFYKIKLKSYLWVTADYQFAVNPGYNKDRGPVNIYAIRTHIEF